MKRMIRIINSILLLSLIGVSSIYAQRAYWTPSGGTLQQGKSNQLQLTFEDCVPETGLAIPGPQGITLTEAGTSNSMSTINGRMKRKLVVNFQAVPTRQGQVSIPTFTAKTDKGDVQVNDAVFEVVEATIGNSGVKPEDVFFNEYRIEDNSIFVGEIFDLRYLIAFKQGYSVNGVSEPILESKNIVTPGLNNFDQTALPYEGDTYNVLIYDTKAMATQAGSVEIPSTSQTVSVVIGRSRSFFSDAIVDNFNVSTKPFHIEIKPLPNGAPDTFHGAVGEFRLDSKVVPEAVQVGEPVTWTLTLSGTGNWPSGIGLPSRSVSTDFRAIQPEIKTEIDENDMFTGTQTEDIVLIPTKEGEFTFGPIEYTYFNPKTEQYETVRIPPSSVKVSGVTQSDLGTPSQEASDTQSGEADISPPPRQVELDPTGVNMLSKPIELPSQPKESGDFRGTLPEGTTTLRKLWWIPVPALGLWLLLAIGRAMYLNPNKQRRAALSTLQKIGAQNSSDNPQSLLLEWRSAVRDFWRLKCEEPSSSEIEQAVGKLTNEEQAATWRSLWERSDSTLFGQQSPLDKAWFSDLQAVLEKAERPGFSLARLFSRIAWKVSAWALLIGCALAATNTATASAAMDSYSKGEFSKAQKAWVDEFESQPDNWGIRTNAGLAAAQQDDWGHALAYWTTAYVLAPKDPSIRWNLKLALNRSGAYDPDLARIVEGKRFDKIVAQLSPGDWQAAANYAIVVTAILLVAWVLTRYLPSIRKLATPLVILALLSIGIAILADWAFSSYGILTQPGAVIVAEAGEMKSLPTDVEVAQLSSSLSEGAIAIQRKTFLGWSQIELPNDEIGWVRTSTLVPVYAN